MTPMAGFENWDACVKSQMSKMNKRTGKQMTHESAEKICGAIKHKVEGSAPKKKSK